MLHGALTLSGVGEGEADAGDLPLKDLLRLRLRLLQLAEGLLRRAIYYEPSFGLVHVQWHSNRKAQHGRAQLIAFSPASRGDWISPFAGRWRQPPLWGGGPLLGGGGPLVRAAHPVVVPVELRLVCRLWRRPVSVLVSGVGCWSLSYASPTCPQAEAKKMTPWKAQSRQARYTSYNAL